MELVTLLSPSGEPIGGADKYQIHGSDTPLHLAFSCYLFDEQDRLLLSRRAVSKLTWPGVWTNSFCGHPAPGEDFPAAIARRAEEELGTTVSQIQTALPNFQYRATDASGVVENEICPVFIARIAGDISVNPEEVAETAWVTLSEVTQSLTATPFIFSPWMQEQLPQLAPIFLAQGLSLR